MPHARYPRLTKDGFSQLEQELARWRAVSEDLKQRMRDEVDESRSEDSNYAYNAFEHDVIRARIDELKHLLAHAELVPRTRSKVIRIGSHVQLADDMTEIQLTVVDTIEADPLLRKVSFDSPFGKALMKKHEGDQIEVSAPRGNHVYRIMAIT